MFNPISETQIDDHTPGTESHRAASPAAPPFRPQRQLGQGGMGVVYLSTAADSNRRIAVKIVRPDAGPATPCTRSLQTEIDVLQCVSHPNIVRFVASGRTVDQSLYLAMEYVAGRNLEQVVRSAGPISPRRVLDILRRICSALIEVHQQGFLHRDIKPANIMTSCCGGRCDVIKLIDFGLADDLRGTGGPQTTGTGTFSGSPLYAAPESFSGNVDQRSDLYSLGATAYELLTGRPVFDVEHPLAAILAHAEQAPVDLRALRRDVPPQLAAIIMTCLRKSPDERYQTAAELAAALEECPSAACDDAPDAPCPPSAAPNMPTSTDTATLIDSVEVPAACG